MAEYEVASTNGHRVRVEADDEQDAFARALDMAEDIEEANVFPADGLPIGWDGGDAEDAIAAGEALDRGDYP